MIDDATDFFFVVFVGLPLTLTFALMPWSLLERWSAKWSYALPSYTTYLVVRGMAAVLAIFIAIEALRYLSGM